MSYVDSLHQLGKFFECLPEVFEKQDRAKVIDWALSTQDPKYKLTNEQHNFLIGRRQYL